MIELFIPKELPCTSVHRLPPKRAYRLAVFEGSPIRYNIARREATVSCSTTFFCEVEHIFYYFASRPVVALWSKFM